MGLNRIDGRIRIKRSTVSGETPTIGVSSDYTDGSWTASTMIYPAEFFMNMADNKLWIGNDANVSEINLIGSGSTHYDFCDTGIKTAAISGCSPVTIYNDVNINPIPETAIADDNYNFVVRAASGRLKQVSGFTGTVSTNGGDLNIVNGLIIGVD